jgi:hypothetical protein
MAYSLDKKIEVLTDMINRLSILSTLLEEEDLEASDQANEAAKVLEEIKKDYDKKYENIYGQDE